MPDKYGSFSELARHEIDGTDYRVRLLERPQSRVAVVAPHGGRIEVGTSELAEHIAGAEHSFFSFEGLKAYGGNRDLHVTSHRFDHPACLALLARSHIALTVHGCLGEASIYLGGRDSALTERLAQRLRVAGFRVHTDGHRYPGRAPLNVCNRTARQCGAQLEFTLDLRTSQARWPLALAVRGALADHANSLGFA